MNADWRTGAHVCRTPFTTIRYILFLPNGANQKETPILYSNKASTPFFFGWRVFRAMHFYYSESKVCRQKGNSRQVLSRYSLHLCVSMMIVCVHSGCAAQHTVAYEPCATGQLLLLPLAHPIHRFFCNILLAVSLPSLSLSVGITFYTVCYLGFSIYEKTEQHEKVAEKKRNGLLYLVCIWIRCDRERWFSIFFFFRPCLGREKKHFREHMTGAHTCHRQPQKS